MLHDGPPPIARLTLDASGDLTIEVDSAPHCAHFLAVKMAASASSERDDDEHGNRPFFYEATATGWRSTVPGAGELGRDEVERTLRGAGCEMSTAPCTGKATRREPQPPLPPEAVTPSDRPSAWAIEVDEHGKTVGLCGFTVGELELREEDLGGQLLEEWRAGRTR